MREFDAEPIEKFVGAPATVASRVAGVDGTLGDVRDDSPGRIQCRVLEHESDRLSTKRSTLSIRQPRRRGAVQLDVASARPQQQSDQIQQRGLAGTRGSSQDAERSLFEVV